MVSPSQLLSDLAISFSSSIRDEPQSSPLKDRLRAKGDHFVKQLFLEDMAKNNKLLRLLGKGSAIIPLTKDALEGCTIPSYSYYRYQWNESDDTDSVRSLDSDGCVVGKSMESSSYSFAHNNGSEEEEEKPNPASIFACAACGVFCYHYVAIIRPTEEAARHLMSASCRRMADCFTANDDANMLDPSSSSGKAQSLDDNVEMVSRSLAQKVESSLDLLALQYGASSDSDDENDIRTGGHLKFSFDLNETPSTYASDSDEDHDYARTDIDDSSDQTDHTESSMAWDCSKAKAITPATTWQVNPVRAEDLRKTHVFCIDHAAEVEQRLRSVGGVDILLLCHQDYPKIEAEAILIAKELRIDCAFDHIEYAEAKETEKSIIKMALDEIDAKDGNRDWTVILGVNLQYSVKVSFSQFYTEQIQFNPILHNAFEKKSSAYDAFQGTTKAGMQPERRLPPPPPPPPAEDLLLDGGVKRGHHPTRKRTTTSRTNIFKRKIQEVDSLSMDESDDGPTPTRSSTRRLIKPPSRYVEYRRMDSTPQTNKRTRSRNETTTHLVEKKARESDNETSGYVQVKIGKKPRSRKAAKVEILEEEREFGCNIEGCSMSFNRKEELMVHKENTCTVNGCGKKLSSHKYLMVHRRVHTSERPLKCSHEGCTKTFKWVWSRTEHMRAHTGEHPYMCTVEGCGQRFMYRSGSSRHRRMTGHSVKKVVENNERV